jgi:hypothetical protein
VTAARRRLALKRASRTALLFYVIALFFYIIALLVTKEVTRASTYKNSLVYFYYITCFTTKSLS